MEWREARQSENVERVQDEPRPYGAAQVTRSQTKGTISAIDPVDLNIKCPITLRNEFSEALKKDFSSKEVNPHQDLFFDKVATAKQTKFIGPEQTVEDSDCKAKIQLFQYELGDAGLEIKKTDVPPSIGMEGNSLVIRGGAENFWASKPAAPGPGK